MKYDCSKINQFVGACTMRVFYEFLHNVSTELSTDIVENCELRTAQRHYVCEKLNCAQFNFCDNLPAHIQRLLMSLGEQV